ncbi:MAG: hypothetical protein ACTSUW_03790 [Candidatus Heimdallarchaeota archaeon]
MIIKTKQIKELQNLIIRIDNDTKKSDSKNKEMSRLRIVIQKMSREAKSIERSGKEHRIREFNRIFIKNLADLSRLTQTTGNSDKREIANLVKKIKAR